MKHTRRFGKYLLTTMAAFTLFSVGLAHRPSLAQAPQQIEGSFGINSEFYNSVPMLVGLIDAAPYFGDAPVTLPAPEDQFLAEVSGEATGGSYAIALPENPPCEAAPTTTACVFDVRLMSDVGERGYMVQNEDNLASSLQINITFNITNGTLIVYAPAAGQFPAGKGADARLFTADDGQAEIGAGWWLVSIDAEPYTFTPFTGQPIDLLTSAYGDVVDYSLLSCSEFASQFLERVSLTYPFTKLYNIDWPALKSELLPMANAATNQRDCEAMVLKFGNAIPDGHVGWYLSSLDNDRAGSLGVVLNQLSDGRVAVRALRQNGPAENAGIQVGAVISQWDGQPIAEALEAQILYGGNSSTATALSLNKLRDLTRGPLGSSIEVTFENVGEPAQTVTLRRDQPGRVNLGDEVAVGDDNLLGSGLGYWRIDDFTDMDGFRAFDAAIDSFIANGVPGIIIDVRGNPGGLSQMADAMGSRFFDTSFILGKQFSGDGRFIYQSNITPRGQQFTGPVAILVDEDTASSGDIFAYIFKSTGRGIIVGYTPSSGMAGTVSGGQYYLPFGGFIQVPTGAMVNEAGEIVVEGTGVVPDVLVPRTIESMINGATADEVLAAAEAALVAVPN
jgi:carboxyl-terminal processing protease